MISSAIMKVLETILYTLIGMLGSSLLAYLIIKVRKWYLIRRSISPSVNNKGTTLEQYIEQIDSVRYVDEWPPT